MATLAYLTYLYKHIKEIKFMSKINLHIRIGLRALSSGYMVLLLAK